MALSKHATNCNCLWSITNSTSFNIWQLRAHIQTWSRLWDRVLWQSNIFVDDLSLILEFIVGVNLHTTVYWVLFFHQHQFGLLLTYYNGRRTYTIAPTGIRSLFIILMRNNPLQRSIWSGRSGASVYVWCRCLEYLLTHEGLRGKRAPVTWFWCA